MNVRRKITEEELLTLGWVDTEHTFSDLKIYENEEEEKFLLYDVEKGEVCLIGKTTRDV